MVLDKYSLDGKTHPHFKFETLYINFQEDFIKFAFFKELVLKLKKIIYYFIYRLCGLFLKISYLLLQKIDKLFKKKGFTLLKEENPSNFKLED